MQQYDIFPENSRPSLVISDGIHAARVSRGTIYVAQFTDQSTEAQAWWQLRREKQPTTAPEVIRFSAHQ
jgi:hypothetical protein